jgi:signal peptidase I
MLRWIKIRGDSLLPDFHEGDFVLISKIPFFFRSPSPGDVVVFRVSPYGTLIKKIEWTDPGQRVLYVVGSHAASLDSRSFGPIDREALLGKVIWHISRKGD